MAVDPKIAEQERINSARLSAFEKKYLVDFETKAEEQDYIKKAAQLEASMKRDMDKVIAESKGTSMKKTDAKKNALTRMLSKKKDVNVGVPKMLSKPAPGKTKDWSEAPSQQKFLDEMMKNQKKSSVPMYMRKGGK